MDDLIEITEFPKSPKLTVSKENDKGTVHFNTSGEGTKKPNLVSVQPHDSLKSVNFGPGVEMFMNPNKKRSENKLHSDINVHELESLDKELLHTGLNNASTTNHIKLKVDPTTPSSNLGNSAAKADKKNETWF